MSAPPSSLKEVLIKMGIEVEQQGQIEWFTDLLEVLEAGNTEAAKESVESAIRLLEREKQK